MELLEEEREREVCVCVFSEEEKVWDDIVSREFFEQFFGAEEIS